MKRVIIAGAVVILNALLFTAGWIVGAHRGATGSGGATGSQPVVASGGLRARRSTPPPAPVPTPLPTPSSQPPPAPPTIDTLLHAAAQRHGIPTTLVRAIAKVESDFDPRNVSHKGARGVMQVMPATGIRFGVSADRLFDPALNIAAGTAYLAWLLARYDGDLDLTLAAYNAGEGAVDKYRGIPPYRETQTYVRRVRSELAQMER